ncbi:hypothetical protein [Flavobacterium sp. H122]|uniref:hypothetical protein n=1 Tax=Flavobacterium sp. H122 TaxID=2529860 RepID=UPI0010A9A118|nr:hypothetical protein [Flavobacterium sp. H122]
MKQLLLAITLLLTNPLFSKNPSDEITLKNGNKAQIKPQTFKIDLENKTISYTPENTTASIKVKFQDFNSAEFGVNKFEVFNFEGNKSHEGYFVMAENSKFRLITRELASDDESVRKFEFLIINLNNTIIDQHLFDNKKNQKSSNLRSDIYGKIKFYFPDNLILLKRLEMYDRNSFSIENTSIIAFFNNPIYFRNN